MLFRQLAVFLEAEGAKRLVVQSPCVLSMNDYKLQREPLVLYVKVDSK